MLQWQLRVKDELRDLKEKQAKLTAFMMSPAYHGVVEPERTLLRIQSMVMADLQMVLAERIHSWKAEKPSAHGGEAFQMAWDPLASQDIGPGPHVGVSNNVGQGSAEAPGA